MGVDQLIGTFQQRFREAYGRENELIAAVLHALPLDPQEAQLLFDEFEHRPDHRFDGEVLMALAQFVKRPEVVREVRARMGLSWRSLVEHPDVISRRDQDQLDALQDILSIGKDSFDQWISRAEKLDLISDDLRARL